MRAIRGMVPPGGWHFPVDSELTLRGDSFDDLAQRLFDYRLHHGETGQALEDIERDIDKYICSKWPHACQLEPADYGRQAPSQPPASMQTRVTREAARWMARQPKGGYELVTATEATQRASICAGCPLNVAWRTGCGSCSANVSAILLNLRKHRNTPHDPNLRGCQEMGADLTTAVHLPTHALKTDSPPPNCWRKCPDAA